MWTSPNLTISLYSSTNCSITKELFVKCHYAYYFCSLHYLAHPGQKKAAQTGQNDLERAAKQPGQKKSANPVLTLGKQKAGKSSKKKSGKSGSKEVAKAKKKTLGRQSSTCLAVNCLDLANAYIGVLRTKVTNYQKQVIRIFSSPYCRYCTLIPRFF